MEIKNVSKTQQHDHRAENKPGHQWVVNPAGNPATRGGLHQAPKQKCVVV